MMYRCDNAFNCIQMGQNPHGTSMCAVVDVMHTIQHGIIMYVLDCFTKSLSAQSLAKLNGMAYIFDTTCCQSIRSTFLRTDVSSMFQECPGLNTSSRDSCFGQSANDNQVPSTREVGSGTPYYVRS